MKILIKDVLLDNKKKDVLISGKRFKKIADSISAPEADHINGTEFAILPAFYNLHTHTAMTLLRGFADDMPLFTWLNNYIWPIEKKITAEDIRIGCKLACLEMIKTGTVYFNDMYWHPEIVADVAAEMGLRADISCVILDNSNQALSKNQIENACRMLNNNIEHQDNIRFIPGPHSIYTVDKQTLILCRNLAEKNNVPIHIHLAETKKEYNDCMEKTGMSPVAYLESIGLLDVPVIAAHGIWINDHDAEILARRKTQVVHCPASNMKLASGYLPWSIYRRHGLLPTLGTDGASSNNSLDMMNEMKLAALGIKNKTEDPVQGSAEEIFHMATAQGAATAGYQAGRIKEGMLADCLLLNLNDPRLTPNHHLISNIVYSAGSDCIDTVICNGRILMRNRHVPGENTILEKARKCASDLISR